MSLSSGRTEIDSRCATATIGAPTPGNWVFTADRGDFGREPALTRAAEPSVILYVESRWRC